MTAEPETRRCPRCGAELAPDTSPEACPRCLMGVALQATSAAGRQDASTADAPTPPPPPPPEPAALEALFPQLEIVEILGQGGMGVVYKARQRTLDREVALKILTVASSDAAFEERFEREAKALASLDHPAIVTVHDFGKAGDHYYLLMEYIDGANLRQVIHAGQISPREALRVVTQICEALQFAHDKQVVHRDIKPENILVDRLGRVKIADFGLAKLLGHESDPRHLTGSRQAMGTPHYMAPEQVEHPQDVDHRADIYSLGVVFYELLTGELPLGRFGAPSEKIRVDVRVDEVVLKTLEKERERRYQHAADVKTEVDGILESPPPAPATESDGCCAGLEAFTAPGGRTLHPMAIASVALGALSFVLLPIVGAIGAIITGKIAQREIGAAPNLYRGHDWARVGIVLGWVGLGLMAGIFMIGVILLLFLAGGITLLPR